MAHDTPPPPDRPPTPGHGSHPPRHDDQRPSLATRLAAVLLGQGHHPLDVARATGVPLALIELINDHLGQQPPTDSPRGDGQEPPPRSHPAPAVIDPAARRAAGPSTGELPHPGSGAAPVRAQVVGWRFRGAARTLRTAFVLNAALAAAAALTHTPALAEASLIGIPLTFAALGLLWLWAMRPPRATPARKTPPRPRSQP